MSLGTEEPAARHSDYFDIIRGLAIFGVVVVHASQKASLLVGDGTSLGPIADIGMYGVELFFFISGALMTKLYGLRGGKPLADLGYWPKRIARILPLWAVFFVVFTVFRGAPGQSPSIDDFLSSYQGIGGWILLIVLVFTFTAFLSQTLWNYAIPGGWSIQAEMAHYAAFAALRRLELRVVLGILVGVNLATISLIRLEGHLPSWAAAGVEAWVRLGVYSTFFYFALGVAAYQVFTYLSRPGAKPPLVAKGLKSPWLLAMIYVATVIALPLPFGNNPQAIGIVALSLVVGYAAQQVSLIAAPLRVLGRYSYFIYFMHLVILRGTDSTLLGYDLEGGAVTATLVGAFAVYLSVSLLVSLPLAWVSFRIIERPWLRLARGRRPLRESAAPGSS